MWNSSERLQVAITPAKIETLKLAVIVYHAEDYRCDVQILRKCILMIVTIAHFIKQNLM